MEVDGYQMTQLAAGVLVIKCQKTIEETWNRKSYQIRLEVSTRGSIGYRSGRKRYR